MSNATIQEAIQMQKTAANPPAVEVANVTKIYRVGHTNYPALRGVSFKIEKGELASIVGPSGSGKSQAHWTARLRVMSSLTELTCASSTKTD